MLTLKEIAEEMGAEFEGDGSIKVIGPSEPRHASELHLAMALNNRYLGDLKLGKARAALLGERINWSDHNLSGVIIVPTPRYAMSKVSKIFHQDDLFFDGIHSSAVINSDLYSLDICVGPFSFIGKGVKIGKGSKIAANCIISDNVTIGDNARIQSGVKIGKNVSIGKNFISQANSVIGSDGFSYVSPGEVDVGDVRKSQSVEDLSHIKGYEKIESLGSVFIEDDVEIGACVAIDRGTIDKTIIKRGCKIDNLVHIAHNVKLGVSCLICGQVGIAGSTIVGDRVVMAGQVGVGDNLTIGSDVVIAGKSGVSSNIPEKQFMMGNPAMPMERSIDAYKAFRRLPRLEKRIKAFLESK